MSLSNAPLGMILSKRPLSTGDVARFRETWANAHAGSIVMLPGETVKPDLYSILCASQDRFRRPHERWQWSYRRPMPFCWGPQGPLMLLGGMLAAYALIVAGVLLLIGAGQ